MINKDYSKKSLEKMTFQKANKLRAEILHKLGRLQGSGKVSKRISDEPLITAKTKEEIIVQALNLQIAILHRLGRTEEAEEVKSRLEEFSKKGK